VNYIRIQQDCVTVFAVISGTFVALLYTGITGCIRKTRINFLISSFKYFNMSINLLEQIQQNLGYPVLQKIDPNTQEVVTDEKTPAEERFSQAAIPAVLTGIYSFVQSDEGAQVFLKAGTGNEVTDTIFRDNKKEVIEAIAAYAKQSTEDPVAKINDIAGEALKITKEQLPEEAVTADVKNFFTAQRNHILLYLPPALNMGTLLHDNTLDDNTHKMEGPISSLMQSLGNIFSGPANSTEAAKP
jgi:hypothetical protein